MDGEELTEQETALYDRQIRVWGADAQRRFVYCLYIYGSGLWTSSQAYLFFYIVMVTMQEFQNCSS